MGKFVNKEIEIIKQKAAVLSSDTLIPGTNEYNVARAELNVYVIQALFGGERKETKKGKVYFRFNHHLPSMEQVAEIAKIMKLVADNEECITDDDDLSIPAVRIDSIKKARCSKLEKMVAGDGTLALHQYLLNDEDVLTLAAAAEKARKFRRNLTIAIAGGTLAIVGIGVGVAIVVCKSKKKSTAVDDTTVEDIDIDNVDVDDVDDVDEVDLDEVDLDEIA